MEELPTLPGDDRELLERASQGCEQLFEQVGRRVIGQQATVQALLASVLCEGHSLIIGVPGLAKTLLVKTLAEILAWKFHRIQFTPDMMPADIIGMELLQDDPATGRRGMTFVPGPIFANLILADEINRTPPKTQSALLEAMQEQTVTSMGKMHRIDRPFVVVATQNPIEQEGTYPLPEAQLDRFMFSLWMDYPSVEDEERIVAETTAPGQAAIEPVFDQATIGKVQALVRRMPVSQHVISYAVALARATRPKNAAADEFVNSYVEWGAGTRAGQHMVLAAKAMAVMEGAVAVHAGHVRQAAPYVLRHRVLPNYQAAGEGVDTKQIMDHVIQSISEPDYA
ncbi:MAG: MoxR family ATPase [Phycisphaeraceae bacterium]